MDHKTGCITINCGCCGKDSRTAVVPGDGVPVGTIISYMGTKVPEHYIACDGAELNIVDYPYLSEQIFDQFGQINYFGGNGTETFAVPDLRNEFLRGYYCESSVQLSGEIGKHQEGTYIKNVNSLGGSSIGRISVATRDSYTWEPGYINADDSRTPVSNNEGLANPVYQPIVNASQVNNGTQNSDTSPVDFLARPTNVAVLYCMRCQP